LGEKGGEGRHVRVRQGMAACDDKAFLDFGHGERGQVDRIPPDQLATQHAGHTLDQGRYLFIRAPEECGYRPTTIDRALGYVKERLPGRFQRPKQASEGVAEPRERIGRLDDCKQVALAGGGAFQVR
jgi:hypothetical protein